MPPTVTRSCRVSLCVFVPLHMLLHVDELVIVDNLAGRTYLMVWRRPGPARSLQPRPAAPAGLPAQLRRPVEIPYSHASMQTEERRDFQKADYLAAVARAKEYIAAGDVMQVQVGQVIAKPFRDAPLSFVPRAAFAEPLALYVFLELRRFSGGRRLAGNPGAPGADRRPGRNPLADHHPAAGRHPQAAARRKKTWRWPPNCRPTPRSAPNT